MLGNLKPLEILIIVLVIVVIFAAPKLPMIAKNIGKSLKVFKSEVKDLKDDKDGSADAGKDAADADAPAPSRLTADTAPPVSPDHRVSPQRQQNPADS